MWEAPPSAVSKSPPPQSQVALISAGCVASISFTLSSWPWPAMTNCLTRSLSIGGPRSGMIGAGLGEFEGVGDWAKSRVPPKAVAAATKP
jgi:hypothetical protein